MVDVSVRGTGAAGQIRNGSGCIDVEDAMSEAEAEESLALGRRIADEEVDGGAELLVVGDMGIGNTTVAATVIAALSGAEPVVVVGRGTGIDDGGWMTKTAVIRDALRRLRRAMAADGGGPATPTRALQIVGGPDLAAMAGFLAQAAVRRTPVLLDGVVDLRGRAGRRAARSRRAPLVVACDPFDRTGAGTRARFARPR